jgi:hypothetical protein
MSEQLQLRNGNCEQVAAFKGASAECVVDTTYNRIVVNDNQTTGGWPAALETRTPVADANYTVALTDRIVAYTAITAPHQVTLPPSVSPSTPSLLGYPIGARLLVVDESGTCSPSNTITITPSGTDKIDGQTSFVINSSYGYVGLESNGAGFWTVINSKSTVAQSPHGASIQFFVTEFLQTITSGSSVTCGTQLPAPALIFSVGVYVVQAIATSGATTFNVGDQAQQGDGGAGAGPRFANDVNVGYQSASAGLASSPFYNWEATNIILTPTSGTFTGGGQVRVSISYALMNPPNS